MDICTKFDEAKGLLNVLTSLVAENKGNDVSNIAFQLKKINNTINELKKNSISVPNELIKLKLDLSKQIDKVKDSERIRRELIQLLEQTTLELKELATDKPIKKEKSKKITIQERVNLIDFINSSILKPNIELYAYYKNTRYSARINNDGLLEMVIKNKKKTFENPRAAAFAVTGYQNDSWKFWKLDFEGKPLSLDDYRKRYFKKKKNDSSNGNNIGTFDEADALN